MTRVILIEPAGDLAEVEIDTTLKQSQVSDVLGGGSVTFVGKIPRIESVVVVKRAQGGLDPNDHVLPYPLDTERFRGRAIVVKTDDDGDPIDITMDEYRDCLEKRDPCEVRA